MRLSDLPKSTRNVINLCSAIGFGHLTELDIIDGDVRPSRATRKLTSVNLDKPAPKARCLASDFELNEHQRRFVDEVRSRRSGHIRDIGIHDGLPATICFDEEVMPAI